MRRLPVLLAASLAAFLALASPATGDSDEQRVQIGLRLFRTLLAADEGLEAKAGPQGEFEVVLLYRDDPTTAEALAEALRSSGHGSRQGTVRERNLRILTSNDPSLAAFSGHPPAGIYLVQRLPDPAMAAVSRWAATHHRLLFSPFDGDVERGASAGLAIEVRVQPYLNREMLDRSQVRIKDLLYKVSKIHEPNLPD